LKRLKELMILLIANDGPLGPEWLDHALSGRLIANATLGAISS
jgi:mRNA-degrading endonuclease YafQ of YafQ-DinJ toxin-antitoxin module